MPTEPIDLLILTALTEEAQVVAAVLAEVATETGSTGDVIFYDYQLGTATARLAVASATPEGRGGGGLLTEVHSRAVMN